MYSISSSWTRSPGGARGRGDGRSRRRRGPRLLAGSTLALALAPAALAGDDAEPDPAHSGRGWKLVSLDLDITVLPEERRFFYEGMLTTRLEGLAASFGPDLLMNIRMSEDRLGMDFETVTCAGAETAIAPELLYRRVRSATVRFPEPKARGDAVTVAFRCASDAPVGQLAVDAQAAVAGWTAMWHPWTVLSTEGSIDWNAGASSARGATTLRLPRDWIGIVDGELVERRRADGGTVETWQTPEGIARSFAAGPYEATVHEVDGRPVRVYLLPGEKTVTREQLAASLGRSIALQEEKFGPFPFEGAYGIVEFPRTPAQSFGAASQQTFILAQPPAFDFGDENVQLWAHEAAHAWWVNTVGTAGAGGKWCGESLAELGAAIAVEGLEGRAAMIDFLDFGRPGMDPYYSAAGYFALMRQGQDLPIATMGSGGVTHALSNSKGVWIYHMLRQRLGDERFFGVLRGLVRDFKHREMSADDVRARFIEATSEHALEGFFAQWLDRTGAPVLDVDWHATVDGGAVLVALTQTQPGQPFALDLEVAVEQAGGAAVIERVGVREKREVFRIATTGRPTGVRLDPGRKLLLWRPAYGPRPGAEIIAEEEIVPEGIRDAVVGLYEFRGMEKAIRVFEVAGAIYVQPAGSAAVRLLHQDAGTFHLDAPGEPMVTEFDLSTSPSPTMTSFEGKAGAYIADRIAEDGVE